jgi:hypothetical protein
MRVYCVFTETIGFLFPSGYVGYLLWFLRIGFGAVDASN